MIKITYSPCILTGAIIERGDTLILRLYKNSSADNVVDKSIKLLHEFDEVIFKEDSSIYSPVIIIGGIKNGAFIDIETISKCNYFSLPKFDRHYYITDIIMRKGQCIEIHGKVDVLMSFKNDIMSTSQIPQLVVRQEVKKNNYLIDSEMPLSSKKQIMEYEFGNPLTDSGYYILATVGGGE